MQLKGNLQYRIQAPEVVELVKAFLLLDPYMPAKDAHLSVDDCRAVKGSSMWPRRQNLWTGPRIALGLKHHDVFQRIFAFAESTMHHHDLSTPSLACIDRYSSMPHPC